MTYYYDCPIKAAYMVREFGIEIAEPVGFDPIALNPKDVDDLLRQLSMEGWGVDDGKIYVAPDSLHIFTAQVGDAVEFDRFYWEKQRDDEYKDYPYKPHYGVVDKFGRDDEWLGISSAGHGWDNTKDGKWALPFKIIQRNNKAFIWPESE